MKKPNITPGDWNQNDILRPDSKTICCISNSQDFTIRGNSDVYTKQHFANAQAIAALPKLLEALETLHNIGKNGVAMIHETGKPQWSALNETTKITRAALLAAGYTE